jgi:hypothetical protein
MLALPNAFTANGPANVVVPSLKVTDPFVTAVPPLVTVAVTVTISPKAEGFGVEVTLVAVDAALTVCDHADDVLPAKLLSPPYEAVIE